jgi:hypothetical protein
VRARLFYFLLFIFIFFFSFLRALSGALPLQTSRPFHHALSLLVCVSDFFLEGFSLGGKNGTHTGCEKNLLKKKYFGGLQICLYD